jgi:hypothetical protein
MRVSYFHSWFSAFLSQQNSPYFKTSQIPGALIEKEHFSLAGNGCCLQEVDALCGQCSRRLFFLANRELPGVRFGASTSLSVITEHSARK